MKYHSHFFQSFPISISSPSSLLFHLTLGSLVTSSLTGCQIQIAHAPREELQAQAYQAFSNEPLRFPSNKLFLWPEGSSTETIQRVMEISMRMEYLEASLIPLNQRHAQVLEEIQQIQDQIHEKNGLVTSKNRQLNRGNSTLRTRIATLEEKRIELQTELARSPSDHSKISSLQSEISALEADAMALQEQLALLPPQISLLQSELTTLNSNPLLSEEAQLNEQIQQAEAQGRQFTEEVTHLVEWYHQQPTSISFEPTTQGEVRVSISGWTLDRNEGARDFSSEAAPGMKPTIENVRYSEQGGIYEFDLIVYEDQAQTMTRETYSFRVARTLYSNPMGKIYMSGKIKRIRTLQDGTLEIRQGVIKLTSSNN